MADHDERFKELAAMVNQWVCEDDVSIAEAIGHLRICQVHLESLLTAGERPEVVFKCAS